MTEEKTGKTLVWVVRVSKDRYENVIARDKIKTGRVATMYADTEQEYTIGTYDGGLLQPHVNPVLRKWAAGLLPAFRSDLYKRISRL